jgi:taurine dioxygenase
MIRSQAVSAAATVPTVTAISPAMGARIGGVDLRHVDEAAWQAIHQAFLDHHLVAFSGQQLTPEQLMDFSRRFGPLESHVLTEFHHIQHPRIMMLSNVIEDGKAKGLADAGSYWHSDISYKARPSRATVLYGVEIPEDGGDTLFCNLEAAYADLPAAMQRGLDGLRAEHNYAYRSNKLAAELGYRKPLTEQQLKETPTVVHPVVRTNPDTGRKAIYINPGFTVRILGMSEGESAALMQQIFDHCLQPKYRYDHHWHVGDVAVWDNAAVMHHATTRELPREKRRTLLRTIIGGDEPY